MTTIVLLKALGDLGFYYTFAGTVAAGFGAKAPSVLLMMFLQAACLTLSFVLSRRGFWRFPPLAALPLCWLLPGMGLAEAAVSAPPAVYIVYLAVKKLYTPQWSQQVGIFSLFWKLFFIFTLFALIFGGSALVASLIVPAGTVTLLCLVLLTRSLRHDPEVYRGKRYQLINIGAVGGAGLLAFLLSTPAFLKGCLAVLKSAYDHIAAPVLMLVIYLIMLLVRGIAWLFSLFDISISISNEPVELDLQSAAELLEAQDAEGSPNDYLKKIFIALGVIAVIAILVLLFRYLSRRGMAFQEREAVSEARERIDPSQKGEGEVQADSSVQRVRALYKRFLRLCRRSGIPQAPSDTSLDIQHLTEGTFGGEVSGLRDIYIGARYDGSATREDAARARELYSRIRRNAPKQ